MFIPHSGLYWWECFPGSAYIFVSMADPNLQPHTIVLVACSSKPSLMHIYIVLLLTAYSYLMYKKYASKSQESLYVSNTLLSIELLFINVYM